MKNTRYAGIFFITWGIITIIQALLKASWKDATSIDEKIQSLSVTNHFSTGAIFIGIGLILLSLNRA